MALSKKLQLLFDHDGSMDDFLSLLLLLTVPDEIDLKGISITPADCYLEPAVESNYKMLSLFNKSAIPIAAGQYNGVNAFPVAWRAKPQIINAFPELINVPYELDPFQLPDSVDFFRQQLEQANEPISVLMTGPCSNLVMALDKHPHLLKKIDKIVWMGGAINVRGNVSTFHHDGSAEWNVFWDPVSAHKLVRFELPLYLVPLDVTNEVPVDLGFLKQLAHQSQFGLSRLAGLLWAITIDTIPSYEYTYFMWDLLATCFLLRPVFFETSNFTIDIPTHGANAGQTLIQKTGGYLVRAVTKVDKEHFYQFILDQFSMDFDR